MTNHKPDAAAAAPSPKGTAAKSNTQVDSNITQATVGNGNGANPEPVFDPAKANAAANGLWEALATQPNLRTKIMADYERHVHDTLQQPGESEDTTPEESVSLVPELTEGAQLPDRLFKNMDAAGGWWSDYVDFASAAARMTPREYHESSGICLLSAAVARRLKTTHGLKSYYTNVYSLNVGPSTLVRKSTAHDVCDRVLSDSGLYHLKLSEL